MDKNFLQTKSLEEVAAQFDDEQEKLSEVVSKIEDIAELEKMEQENIEEQKMVKEYIDNRTYELQKSIEFDGEKYTVKDVVAKIIYFLNKKEVEWKFTRGMLELVKFWKSENPTIIAYGAYDSTLRLLNQVMYKGYSEWRDINVVNEYLRTAHGDYSKDTSWVYSLANKHNTILDRIDQLKKLQAELDGDGSDKDGVKVEVKEKTPATPRKKKAE